MTLIMWTLAQSSCSSRRCAGATGLGLVAVSHQPLLQLPKQEQLRTMAALLAAAAAANCLLHGSGTLQLATARHYCPSVGRQR